MSSTSGTSQPTAKSAREPSLRRRRSRWTSPSASCSRPAQQSVPAPTCAAVEHALPRGDRQRWRCRHVRPCGDPARCETCLPSARRRRFAPSFREGQCRTSRAHPLVDGLVRRGYGSLRSSPVRRSEPEQLARCDPYDPSPRPAASTSSRGAGGRAARSPRKRGSSRSRSSRACGLAHRPGRAALDACPTATSLTSTPSASSERRSMVSER